MFKLSAISSSVIKTYCQTLLTHWIATRTNRSSRSNLSLTGDTGESAGKRAVRDAVLEIPFRCVPNCYGKLKMPEVGFHTLTFSGLSTTSCFVSFHKDITLLIQFTVAILFELLPYFTTFQVNCVPLFESDYCLVSNSVSYVILMFSLITSCISIEWYSICNI